MKTALLVPVVAALALCIASVRGAPVISNPAAAQRPGTKLVDIDYNLTGTTNPVAITLEISADGGTTWAVPVTAVTGAVGANVTPGSNLRITWDGGVDWNNQLSPQMQFRLKGSEALQADFALVPAGEFTMGDTLDGLVDATLHTVNVSTFNMQKLGVTKAQWDAVREWGMGHGYTDFSVGGGKAADHPVVGVTWYDAVKWCNAKSEMESLTPCYFRDGTQTAVFKTGLINLDDTMVKWTADGYRLPTEAEREKAGRGGLTGQRFPWGGTISHYEANFQNNGGETYQAGTTGLHPTYATGGTPNTAPVGNFDANAYGIHDMAGNAWEWCWDWYGPYPTELTADPHGPSGSKRVIRGGGWNASASYCRVAIRPRELPSYTGYDVGFRPVRAFAAPVTAESPNTLVNTNNPILTITGLHGTVPGAGQYPLNTPVELIATPDLGYLFSKWTGDATGTANPLTVTMDSDKTINAIFVTDSRDPDVDGLTNFEELITYGTLTNVADTDGDGFTDGYEVHHGTLPKDPASRPDATLQIFTAVEVRLDTALGQNYRIESSTDLQNWTVVEEHIAGTGGTVTRFYSIQEIPKRYFKPVRE